MRLRNGSGVMVGAKILPIHGEGDRPKGGGGGYRPRASLRCRASLPAPSVTPSARHLPVPGRIG